MENRKTKLGVIIGATSFLLANAACAFDMGNMMNPSKWMGGDKDDDRERYDEYYDGPGYGYPDGPPGYGYGGAPGYGPGSGYDYGSGPGYGAAPGYGYGEGPGYGGAPGYGAAPGYDYGGAPGYGAPGGGAKEAEIKRLKERLRQLEGDVK